MDAPTGAATAAPQSPPDDADELRLVLVTVAVAHLRLGPRSSASISTTVLFSPSWFSQERCFSRPVTTTRLPRVSVSAAFSARLRQQLIVKNDVSPYGRQQAPGQFGGELYRISRAKVQAVGSMTLRFGAGDEGVVPETARVLEVLLEQVNRPRLPSSLVQSPAQLVAGCRQLRLVPGDLPERDRPLESTQRGREPPSRRVDRPKVGQRSGRERAVHI